MPEGFQVIAMIVGAGLVLAVVLTIFSLVSSNVERRREAEERARKRQLRKEQAPQRKADKAERRADLVRRFGEEATIDILSKRLWQGATEEMVIEALGQPSATDVKTLKTKTKKTMKYGHTSGNRYVARIYLVDGVVVGWDKPE